MENNEKTITQVSEETGISQSTLHAARRAGRLPVRRVGFIWLVNTSDPKFQEFLSEHQKWLEARGKGTKDREKD